MAAVTRYLRRLAKFTGAPKAKSKKAITPHTIIGVLHRRTFSGSSNKHIQKSQIAPAVLNAQYAVRGAIVIRANEIQNDLKKVKKGAPNKYPFNSVIMCNIGNPQELGQKPLTFHRQVLSSLLSPSLLEKDIFPDDVKARAKKILNDTASQSIGAYTHSQGMYWYILMLYIVHWKCARILQIHFHHIFIYHMPSGLSVIRETVCDFICERDGLSRSDNVINPQDIFLTDGASPGIKYILQALIGGTFHLQLAFSFNIRSSVFCPYFVSVEILSVFVH